MSSDSPTPPPPAPIAPPPAAAPTPPPPPVTPAAMAPIMVERKSGALAGFLSFFPGLGHLYLGLYQRAFAFGGAFILLCGITSHGRGGETFSGLALAFVWFFSIIDAVRQAHAINRGYVAESGYAPSRQLRTSAGTGSLTWGIILFGIGVLWLATKYLDLERFWDIVGDWGAPVAIIILGLVLILTYVKNKRDENEKGIGMPPRSS